MNLTFKRGVWLALFATALASVASAAEPAERAKTFHGDGTWSYAPDPTMTVGDLVWEGNTLWQYTGAARYNASPRSWPHDVPFETDGGPPPSRLEQIIGSVRVDEVGHRWVAIDAVFDEEEATSAIDQEEDEEPQVGTWTPQSWDDATCSGDVLALWDAESRSTFSSLSADRHYRIMLVETDEGQCTGVQVGPRDVLVNGHCVTDPDFPSVTVDVHAVCSRGNSYTGADCISAPPGSGFVITLNSAWSGGNTAFQNDYALIEWSSNGATDVSGLTGMAATGMPLSTMSNGEIEAQDVAMYGHPEFRRPGGVCTSTVDTTEVDSQMSFGMALTFEWRDDHNVTSNLIKVNIDCAPGQSGAAYFACPNDPDCSEGEELVGLHAGYASFLGEPIYCGGPKVGQFATFLATEM